jgi:S1-C subfamily serine protease
MSFNGESPRSRSVLLRGALIVLIALIAGVLVGHLVWSATTTTLRLSPASNRFGRFRYGGPGGIGSGEYGAGRYDSGGSLFGPGGSPGETGGSSSESGGSSSGSSSGVSSSITSKVDPALVDIDVDLGLEGGEAAGTGMVVSSAGEVITNNHVITGATKITATDVGNGTTYTARVVGYDHGHDIAVLQLEGASGLKTVSFGDASSLKVGQSVATIGNAGGTGGTPSATAGQVSALDQSITAGDELDGSQEHLSGLIQIDGDLQPGDSGGPLVNSSGEVLGMDTAASSTFQFESSANEGFAIPLEEVWTIVKEIREGGRSRTIHIGATGLLGVQVQSQSSEGAFVENVLYGTPAASGGLSAGDVITGLDGTSVSSPTALTELILEEHPGNSVRVTWRTPAGEQQTATVTLAEGPPE